VLETNYLGTFFAIEKLGSEISRKIEFCPRRKKSTFMLRIQMIHQIGFKLCAVTRFCLVAAICLSDASVAADKVTQVPLAEGGSARALARTFSLFSRSYEWALDASTTDKVGCADVMAGLKSADEARWINPKVVTSNSEDSAFSNLNACVAYHSDRAKAGTAGSKSDFFGVGSIGDQYFQLYEVALAGSNRKPWSIVYGQFAEAKLVTNRFFDGYSTVERESCRTTGSVPVQRQISMDLQHPSTQRDFVHGIFASGSGVFVVVGSEQTSGRYDPDAVRELVVWRLQNTGKFAQQCVWMPKGSPARMKGG
jgi:hypothetical protein